MNPERICGKLAVAYVCHGALVTAVRTVEVGGNGHLGGDAGTIGSNSHADLGDPVR
jgi:hypothetical protein